jgi:DNA polymerase
MTNQSYYPSDTDSIGKWSDWQGKLNAEIMLIGQDWGSTKYWEDNEGKDTTQNPTNFHLKELFNHLGFDIGDVSNPNHDEPIFFTNSVLCLKTGNMSSTVYQKCFSNCGENFLKPLIDLISPKILITLGAAPFKSVLRLYRPEGSSQIPPLRDVVRHEPIIINTQGLKLFPMFHCGGLGLANRKFEEQKTDWDFIKPWMQSPR